MDGYHPNYPSKSERCKELAGWACEACGVLDGSIATTMNGKRQGRPHVVYLTGAHVNENDKGNPDPELMALCPRCHGLYDHGSPAQKKLVLEAVKENRQNRKA